MENRYNTINGIQEREEALSRYTWQLISEQNGVSMKVTKEDVSDCRMLKPLVQQAASSSIIITINKVIADAAYDSNNNFMYLAQIGI